MPNGLCQLSEALVRWSPTEAVVGVVLVGLLVSALASECGKDTEQATSEMRHDG